MSDFHIILAILGYMALMTVLFFLADAVATRRMNSDVLKEFPAIRASLEEGKDKEWGHPIFSAIITAIAVFVVFVGVVLLFRFFCS